MTAQALQDHPILVAAGASQDLAGPLDFLRLHASTGELEVETDTGRASMGVGDEFSYSRPIAKARITNKGIAAVAAIFRVGLGVKSSRTGTVVLAEGAVIIADVFSASFDLVKGGAAAFFGGFAKQDLNFHHAQIWNPAASTVDVAVQVWQLSAGNASIFKWGRYGAALATLHAVTSRMDKLNLTNPGATPKAELRSENKVAQDFATLDYPEIHASVTPTTLPFGDPVVLEPGNGLGIMGVAANNTVCHIIQWREKVRP